MGTNYFVRPQCPDPCAHCAPVDIHLGKSSIGWAFTFRAYSAEGDDTPQSVTWPVQDFASWLKLLDLGQIVDEYGRHGTRDDLLALIEVKRGGRSSMCGSDFRDADGNRFVIGDFC